MNMLMMAAGGVLLAVAGFSSGYGVREALSQWRRASARRARLAKDTAMIEQASKEPAGASTPSAEPQGA